MIEAYCSESGTVLLLTRGEYFEAKKLLEQFALILNYDSSLLLTIGDGIIGIFCPLQNLFNINQFGLELSLGSLSF